MKACPIFTEGFRASGVIGLHLLKIAQRFNAGFGLGGLRESHQGRQKRDNLFPLLSSLTGLWHFDPATSPALKRWAIFGNTDGWERDTLRLAS